MKTETGVMVMKNGKAWGFTYKDGHKTSCGWVDLEDATIHDPAHCKQPTDVTYKGSPYEAQLRTAKLVSVQRTTTVKVSTP